MHAFAPLTGVCHQSTPGGIECTQPLREGYANSPFYLWHYVRFGDLQAKFDFHLPQDALCHRSVNDTITLTIHSNLSLRPPVLRDTN